MAEPPLKRHREETDEEEEVLKRQKSYKDIISILEGDEEEPNEDLSSIITTLQQEISSASDNFTSSSYDFALTDQTSMLSSSFAEIVNPSTAEYFSLGPPDKSKEEEEEDDERERVMRHLIEASDDELGIPSTEGRRVDDDQRVAAGEISRGDLLPLDDSLWEVEDEAANYSSLLQSLPFL
ncbi:hypothetical protein Nepgr_017159 [Nepenthes gracilis]|uniref:Uncharacterized protein n=1 Tax=Nepenthes gracilis TaxID=150966 RepID=A0AAD3SNY5_NEPGR|nr:hypothetical protein Nepgr_017159 [Nepenthes gracilis]